MADRKPITALGFLVEGALQVQLFTGGLAVGWKSLATRAALR
jgi:hypothetical protein